MRPTVDIVLLLRRFDEVGYTVRPSTLPIQEETSTSTNDGGGGGASTSSCSAQFQPLRVPFKFDTDGISKNPNNSPPNHHRGDSNSFTEPHIQVHRVNDFPSTWQPARRIIAFMGLVSLVCTLLVVVIIIIAVALSRSTAGPYRDPQWPPTEGVAHLFPAPRRFVNRTPTIVVHRQNRQFWSKYVADLTALLKVYKEKQGNMATSNCDLHYAPIGMASCSFPLERISDNCSAQNNFGYDTGNPCVALVFNVHSGWLPVPYNKSNPAEIPEALRANYDEHSLPVTCETTAVVAEGSSHEQNSSLFRVNYSPFQGFPFKYLPFRGIGSSGLPPIVMIQFIIGSHAMADVDVSCTLWAKNLPRNSSVSDPGSIRFSFFIM
ncbi:hypothetical protein JTE90_012285 [Oedothorax gibbosus]|uniref:Sodium/potassium-transporting ATPase subunit beta n=1 Tax=Oedothorax gibbosus TaxID=931172 RepID=A0AAV6VJ10_9ARAC|nr:hypothetical protein JTE90_012285 [Oedothorax gibbosus]